ncbi:MAG: YggU family protein [Deltaproteobacteria bacterium]|nr:YggU family protein [Deltaproteobacteria bacterium]
MPVIKENKVGLILKVLIQPRSSKNIITGLHGDALKIKLTAPPVDGAANKMCVQYLAKSLKIPKSSLEIISGQTSRQKTVLIKYENDDNSQSERKRLKELIESFF